MLLQVLFMADGSLHKEEFPGRHGPRVQHMKALQEKSRQDLFGDLLEEGRHETSKASKAHRHNHKKSAKERTTCTDLVNHGTHFTVEIEVGTPGQKFDVVADTGSDAIIVPSCACVKAGYCNPKSRCFQGTNRSSTFAIEDGPQGPPTIRMMFGSGPVQAVVASDTVSVGELKTNMKDGILLMTDQLLNIKGQFEGILGLGLPSADAKKGLYQQSPEGDSEHQAEESDSSSEKSGSKYVAGSTPGQDVVDPQRIVEALENFDKAGGKIFPFPAGVEGSAPSEEGDARAVADLMEEPQQDQPQPIMNLAPTSFVNALQHPLDNAAGTSLLQKPNKKLNPHKSHVSEAAKEDPTNSSGIVVKGFMEEAGIKRFSMCFNDGANGVLRLGTPKAKTAHGSVGQVHWGLDFRGISVGDASAPVEFCKTENMTKGQKTPCGAIPDSGTTAFMAPKDHLITLYGSLCDRWERCKKNHTAMVNAAEGAKEAAEKAYSFDPFNIEPASKAVIFQQLIFDCKDWLTKEKGLDELPPIHFHVGGINGTKQTLNLLGWSYIIETQEKEFKYIYKKIPGLGKMPVGKNFTGHTRKVCAPAFSTMEYSTEQNGPVWILGTPIFYEYQVGYDMSTKPPAISFADTPCGSCKGETATKDDNDEKTKASFVSHTVDVHKERRVHHARAPRYVGGPLRIPSLDITKPL